MLKRDQLYWVWAEMRARCNRVNHKHFKNYGGRGITVCNRWDDFNNFMEDMGPRPLGGLLERTDNNKGYFADNCRWATRKEQNSNRRNCIYVNDNGELVTLKEFCRRHHLSYRPIVKRIQDRNWPLQLAISLPVGSGRVFYRNPPEPS